MRATTYSTSGRPLKGIERLERREMLAVTLMRSGHFVDMDLGDFFVRFDTELGGTPGQWNIDDATGTLITNPFPGEGVTIAWDQANDPTQASANGLTTNPIARLDGAQAAFNYYGRETEFSAPNLPFDSAFYEVTGFAPFFWLSHEPGDDAIPTESMAQWRTLYNPGSIPDAEFYSNGAPVFFEANGSSGGAIFMIGDDVVDPSPLNLSWNQRLAEMREGRVAAKVQVSLANAGSDAVASLMFRRDISADGTVTEGEAFASPGYFLNTNKFGDVQITRVGAQGGIPSVVWRRSSRRCRRLDQYGRRSLVGNQN